MPADHSAIGNRLALLQRGRHPETPLLAQFTKVKGTA
jgi:hypothetical protein